MATTVIITGKPGTGKTTLLTRCPGLFGPVATAGILCPAPAQGRAEHASADRYYMRSVASPRRRLWAERLPWAERRSTGSDAIIPDFTFHDEVRADLEAGLAARLGQGKVLCWVMDDIGPLELAGAGWAPLLHRRRVFSHGVLILVVKKRLLPELLSTFHIGEHVHIDLDSEPLDDAETRLATMAQELETARIGEYSGMCGTVEIGLGSLLHAGRIPLKGHFLSLLQNAMLVLAGNGTGGRGILRITFITALLKAFSPMVSPLRPMLSIALQGGLFGIVTALTGWNLPGVLAASILMGWLTVGLGLLFQYILFGDAFFAMLSGLTAAFSGALGITFGLGGALLALLALRALLSTIVATVAWYGRLTGLVETIERRFTPLRPDLSHHITRTWLSSALGATRDLLRPFFLFFMALSLVLLVAFSPLSAAGAGLIFLRGLVVAFVVFTLQRRVHLPAFVKALRRRAGARTGRALEIALSRVAATEGLDSPRPPEKPIS